MSDFLEPFGDITVSRFRIFFIIGIARNFNTQRCHSSFRCTTHNLIIRKNVLIQKTQPNAKKRYVAQAAVEKLDEYYNKIGKFIKLPIEYGGENLIETRVNLPLHDVI